MKSNIITFFLVVIIFCNCYKENHCGETAGVEASAVGISFYSIASSKYMYAAGVPSNFSLYNRDSLIIKDQTGAVLSLLTSIEIVPNDNTKLYYKFGLTPIYNSTTDAAAFNQEFTKKFYIQYNSTERDTLICTFKANRNECNSYFEYLKVYYKNNLIGSSNYITCDVTINKP